MPASSGFSGKPSAVLRHGSFTSFEGYYEQCAPGIRKLCGDGAIPDLPLRA